MYEERIRLLSPLNVLAYRALILKSYSPLIVYFVVGG